VQHCVVLAVPEGQVSTSIQQQLHKAHPVEAHSHTQSTDAALILQQQPTQQQQQC
jgi:2-methylcitrate dehydratase PrpD